MSLATQPELVKAEAGRITQLIVHAAIAMTTGILLIPSPNSLAIFNNRNHEVPGWPVVYAVWFFLAGTNLLIRVVWKKKTRHIRWPLILLSIPYAILVLLFFSNVLIWLIRGLEGPTPVSYPIPIYVGYFIFLLLHIEGSKPANEERRNGLHG
jgi:TRAP-type C4-dicarboxylate transport system permease small subunit